MKICMVTSDKVRISRAPTIQFYGPETSLEPVEIQVDTLILKPRELNGITCLVAYDHETDTLFVKAE